MFNNDAVRRVGPFAFVVDEGAGADGVKHGGGGGPNGFGLLGDVDGRESYIAHALVEQAGGVGVAVDCRCVEIVVVGNAFRAKPVEEVEFDIGALFVAADGALPGVTRERGGLAATKGASTFAVRDRTGGIGWR